jgi:hypothetical protein
MIRTIESTALLGPSGCPIAAADSLGGGFTPVAVVDTAQPRIRRGRFLATLTETDVEWTLNVEP